MLSSYLDVDEYDTHAFTVRGINFIHETKTDSLEVFSGFLSQETNLPYLRVSTTSGGQLQETKLGAVIYRRKLSDTLQFHSLNMTGGKLTSIQSLGWRPSRTWKFAGAAGIGSGAGYLGGSGEFHQKILDLRTSYTISGASFQRQEGLYYSTEPDGLNARFSIAPIPTMKFTLDHERNRTSVIGLPSVTSAFDSASMSASLKGFQFSPTVSTVTTNNLPGRTNTEMLSVSRRILPRWRAFGAYINMESPTMKQQTYVATNEFKS
jgi:hypothetical protein